jgi:hypothetical protein
MRKFAALFVLVALPASGFAASGPQTITNEAGLAYNNTYPQNLQSYGNPQSAATKLSAQVTFGSATLSAQTFTDGEQSTGSITVNSNVVLASTATDSITVPSTSAILGSPSTAQYTIVSTQPLVGQGAAFTTVISSNFAVYATSVSVILNGQYIFTAGTDFTADPVFSTNTATNLASAIQTKTSGIYTASLKVNVSTGVLISCASSSTLCNGYTVNTTSPTALSSGTMSGGINPAVVTANGFSFTANKEWLVVNNATTTAQNLATALDILTVLVATNSGTNVVYASSTLVGTAVNSFTLTSSTPAALSVSSTNFSGGKAPALLDAYFSINGANYLNGFGWSDISGTSTGTAASIAAFLNATSTNSATCGGGAGNILATAVGGVVNLRTWTACAANNAITLATTPSSGGLTIGSALFTGGADNGAVSINGKIFTAGVDFSTGAAASNTATNLATAITASSTTIGVTAQAIGAVVTATSTVVGSITNYAMTSSTDAALTLSGPKIITAGASVGAMTGGVASSFTINTQTINIPNHRFTTALPVLYSTGVVAITNLVNQTTYFVVVVDANNIKLSSTSVVALTGNGLVLASSTTGTTAHTYTLTPGPFIQGPASGKWQVSNDGTNWNDYLATAEGIAVTSQTFVAVNPSTTTVQDFGPIDYGWIRYNALGPTQGGVTLKVILNAKD